MRLFSGFLFERGGRGRINFETAFERGKLRPSLRRLRRGWFYCGKNNWFSFIQPSHSHVTRLTILSRRYWSVLLASVLRTPRPPPLGSRAWLNLVSGAPAHYLESTAFGAMISVPHWTFFVVERIKESFCSGRQLHHSPLLQSAVYIQVLLLSV